jgi:hypothetical protein
MIQMASVTKQEMVEAFQDDATRFQASIYCSKRYTKEMRIVQAGIAQSKSNTKKTAILKDFWHSKEDSFV